MIFHNFHKPVTYLDYLQFQERSRKKKLESMLFLQHPMTITSGVSSKDVNLLISPDKLLSMGVDFIQTTRGGDFTGHEIGQIVTYFHINLADRKMEVGKFLAEMQTSLIEITKNIWNIELISDPQNPGLYLKSNPEKKAASLGVYFKSFFTSFGFALNLSNSGKIFQYINPCGINSNRMVSLADCGADPSLRDSFIRAYGDYWIQHVLKKYPAKNQETHRWF
ncbi:lipoyl protein ligase domain-containing protein [Leptospira sp. GIMC2001]|uniref:lipoyl protein ligase domain-containing protein n=1 Tax=Leptospira sp. GIMC2001 TaxID=1513297 RepID=UPI002349A56C|nr:lipoyl(octanoyl) transferase [Leptospira sp. GIMC2001]WCL50532.1 lipoyl(octanoyl) transferase [Leptospira sp. GIMC2001]